MSKNYKVGYGKPPEEHRFKKGQSGNPNGRRRRKKPAPVEDNSLRAILKRTGEQIVEVGGKKRSLFELEILALQHKAAKGDVAASRHLAKLRIEAGLLKPAPASGGGVLIVPGILDADTWERRASQNQAKYRETPPEES